ATRKLARDLGIDLRTLAPTGKGGRVSKDDVRRGAGGAAPQRERAVSRAAAPVAAAPVAAAPVAAAPVAAAPVAAAPVAAAPLAAGAVAPIVVPVGDDETRTPLKGVRKRIFENMARSKHTAAHFTFVEEC